MDGNVTYASLKEAVDALNSYAQKLDDPIDRYMEQSGKIGEQGSNAWGGTAAESVVPTLMKIKSDIEQLQRACSEFSNNVNQSLSTYEQADTQNVNKVNEVI